MKVVVGSFRRDFGWLFLGKNILGKMGKKFLGRKMKGLVGSFRRDFGWLFLGKTILGIC